MNNRTRNLIVLLQGIVLLWATVVQSGSPGKGQFGLHSEGGPWKFYRAAQTDPDLPRVLLIGDSITNGYRGLVAGDLKGKANVDCWMTPKHLNSKHLRGDLKKVLAQGPYDVVHFNIGLHGWPEGCIPDGQYEPLLRKYVGDLRRHSPKARLVWASTTQITVKGKPDKLDPVHNATIVKRNTVAARVMTEHGIPVNDLYGLMADKLKLARGDRFHWSGSGIKIQGRAVTAVIRKALARSPASRRYVLDMVFNNLGESPRVSAFNAPKRLADWGYTGQVPHLYVQCAVTFDSLKAGVVPEGSAARKWIAIQARKVDKRLSESEAAGIGLYPYTDFLIIPRVVQKQYKSELGDLSIRRPFVQKIIRLQVREIFERFPKLGGLTLRFGETYLHDTPHHVGRSPVRSPEDHAILINLLREEVCVKRKKKVFYRTWVHGGFHVNPNFYLKATDPVEPHPNLIFSIKHTRGDFLRTYRFNPTIGVGKHQQIVEVQCQREYEGKGAHPNYIAHGVIEGFEELVTHKKPKCLRDVADQRTFAGVWTWSRGGGWKGPYIKNEFWCALDAYVVSRWAQNPKRSEKAIFREYASQKLGLKGKDIDRFRELCLLSTKGVLRGQYSLLGGVRVDWERDQYLGGLRQLGGTFNGFIKRNLVDKALAEKAEAVAIWRRIETLAKQIDLPDAATKEFVVTSCTYGRIKYEIIANGWTVMLLGMVGDKTGQYDKPRIAAAIKTYDKLWDEWKKLEKSSPSCATIYKNHYCRYVSQKGMFPAPGMNDSVNKYRRIVHQDKIIEKSTP
ncbi:MAG: hypothetical protein GY794_11515 [bacterium]|nr:hypothetical protein [bacterium]